MSLSFLSKKSWHTSTVKNVEEVWKREEKEREEKVKLKELQKQIDDERKIQEMRELAGKAQQIKVTDNSLDWMYQGPKADDSGQNNDDYLLGKTYAPKTEEKSDIHKLQDSKKVGALWLNKVSSKNDTFSRISEDPLMMMKKTEIEARERILNNPVKMAKIKHDLRLKLGEDEIKSKEKKAAKKAKKALKKEKKEKKHKDKKRERDSSTDDDDDNSREHNKPSESRDNQESNRERDSHHRNRSHSNSKDRQYKRNDRDDRDRNTSRRSRSRSRSRDRDYDRSRDRDYDRSRDRDYDRSRDRDYDRRPRDIYNDRHNDRDSTKSNKRESDKDNKDEKESNDITYKSSSSGYGLVTGKVSNKSDKAYLGPQRELIEKKLEQEKADRDSKLNRVRENVTSLTEEEKQRRIQAMQQDADEIDEMRTQRFVETKGTNNDDDKEANTGSAKFLKEMRTNVLADCTMESRVKQNKYFLSKGGDDDDNGGYHKP